MTTLETTALGYPLPHADNNPRAVDVPRMRIALEMITAHIEALHASRDALADDKADKLQVAIDIAAAVTRAISDLLDGAPAAYDTLVEIADKLTDNDDVVANILSTLATKAVAADVADALATKADASLLDYVVSVNATQTFTEEQRDLARLNIGALGSKREDVEAALGGSPITAALGADITVRWEAGLALKVGATDFGITWPIDIGGTAAVATTANYASSAGNSSQFGGQFPSWYAAITDRLGYTPIRTLSSQMATIHVGWSSGAGLTLQVNSNYMATNWPINITGTANYATSAGSAGSVPAAHIKSTIAAAVVNDIGSYVLANVVGNSDSIAQGTVVLGSGLRYASTVASDSPVDWLPGTWMCCGKVGVSRISVFKRVS